MKFPVVNWVDVICVFGLGVLNLKVAMKAFSFAMILIVQLFLPVRIEAQVEIPARLLSPLPGEALQGVVLIELELDPTQTTGYELAYAYQNSLVQTWFLISESKSIETGLLQATWDTTTISDGDFQLRLRVFLTNGLLHEVYATGLRIRNYSTIETKTPSPTPLTTGTAVPPTTTPEITAMIGIPTLLPDNPARYDQLRMIEGIKTGLLIVMGGFAFLGIYYSIRRIQRKRE
jgi:hypothetical protein